MQRHISAFVPSTLLVALVATLLLIEPNSSSTPIVAAPKEAKPDVAECRWADTPIVIDGKDDDAAWKHAQVIDSFGQPWEKGKVELRGKTRAKLLWDRDYMYFFA